MSMGSNNSNKRSCKKANKDMVKEIKFSQFQDYVAQQSTSTIMKCSCKKSKCLKMYCECFAKGSMCNKECGCLDCSNLEG